MRKILDRAGVWRLCFEGGEGFLALDRVEALLRDQLKPEMEAFERLLRRDLSHWKRDPSNLACVGQFRICQGAEQEV